MDRLRGVLHVTRTTIGAKADAARAKASVWHAYEGGGGGGASHLSVCELWLAWCFAGDQGSGCRVWRRQARRKSRSGRGSRCGGIQH